MGAHIWFNLLMWSAGHVYWMNSYETLEECQVIQTQYEAINPAAAFLCPFVMVEIT